MESRYRLPLKLQVISWFLLSDNVAPHITSYQRLIDIKDRAIELNTYELSEFYQVRYINDNLEKWVDGLVIFLSPKLSRFYYDLGEVQLFVEIKVIHKKTIISRNIKLNTEL